jgi:hypothetical protein
MTAHRGLMNTMEQFDFQLVVVREEKAVSEEEMVFSNFALRQRYQL